MSPTPPNDFHTRVGFGLCTIARADRIPRLASQGTTMIPSVYFLIAASIVMLCACGGGGGDSDQATCTPPSVYQDLIQRGALKPLPDPLPPGYEWHAPWLWHPNPSDPAPFPGPAQPAFLGPFYVPGEIPSYVCKE